MAEKRPGWQPKVFYKRGDQIEAAGYVFQARKDGTSGDSEPEWTFRDVQRGTNVVPDGSVVWLEVEKVQDLGLIGGR